MSTAIDGVLLHWGDRLFYPGNRIIRGQGAPRLRGGRDRSAAAVRERIAAVVRRAPQVMVKVTGGGRGMRAIAAHFRYITKNGRLPFEDERESRETGKDALRELLEEWRLGGTPIEEVSDRREAFNIMLSMPRGTDPLAVLRAARAFAKIELAGHKYVMVLHDHQANPHVHLSVRAESTEGRRINPRKMDLQRWRETFAEQLRELGIDAEATRRTTRFQARRDTPLWRLKAREEGRERTHVVRAEVAPRHAEDIAAWSHVAEALASSATQEDRHLAAQVVGYLRDPESRMRVVSTQKSRWPVPSRMEPPRDRT